MVNSFQITCSRCGNRSRKFRYEVPHIYYAPEEIVKAGWGSFGSAFYCPKCARTWEKRNGKDRPLWGNDHTIQRCLENMVRELLQEISIMNGTFVP